MIYWIIAGSVFLVWFARRKLFTPWGRYVSHTETKSRIVFMTVKHVSWFPPFLDKSSVWCSSSNCNWSRESDGIDAYSGMTDHRPLLSRMLFIANARKQELDEALR